MIDNIPPSLRNASGIYEIRNLVNGKVYVGSTVCFGQRIKGHKSDLIKHKHGNPMLLRAYLKYGPNALSFTVKCSIAKMDNESRKDFNRRLHQAEYEHILQVRGNCYNILLNPMADFEIEGKGLIENATPKISTNMGSGSNNHLAVIDEEIAKTIKLLLAHNAPPVAIARFFSVKPQVVYSIKDNRTWKHVLVTKESIELFQLPCAMEKFKTGTPVGIKRTKRTPQKKLQNGVLIEIKLLLQKNTPINYIASKFGVSGVTITKIKQGKVWSEITGIDPVGQSI